MIKFSNYFQKLPILPILQADNAQDAVFASAALFKGGIDIIEVVLRTKASLEAITAIRKEVPQIKVGAGTIITPTLCIAAKDAGAEYLISPGSSPKLLEAMLKAGLPALPAIANASDIILAQEMGFSEMKFFPAHINGGVSGVKTLSSVFPDVKFCPTGGINGDNAKSYLELKNIFAVGGSWLLPEKDIKMKNWQAITDRAKELVVVFGQG